ncbi:hypothetical protein B0H16DRAFT_1476844 [Mycena metata]|uniref:Uncharacterized protein n=1 Tax=Mycena metata TaxID=1033252 RepID=A0AAD7HAD8_9AGAR|nr:hypothetical protein B0H16DRAFT_1476844 [Mycena metata]
MDVDLIDFASNCVPPWSNYTLADRGKIFQFPVNLLSLVEDQLEVLDHRRFVESTFRHAYHLDSNLEDNNRSADSDSDVMSQTNSEPSSAGSTDGWAIAEPMSDDFSVEDDVDKDYMPSPEWISGWVDHWASYLLRSRLPESPEALAGLSPVPKILTAGHMDALKFASITWDEPRPFTDVAGRICGFFLGSPVQRTAWERTIIQASEDMYRAHASLSAADENVLRAGIAHSPSFGRPCNITIAEANKVTLAVLRHSKAIQDIISYQNAMLQAIAPRLWNLGRETADAICAHDSGLRTPFRIPGHHQHQPTVFAEVEYRFRIEDSMPRVRERAAGRVSGWNVLTSLGHYDSTEGLLILWESNNVLAFPPGSTVFLPTGVLTSSFTAVSETASQMLIVQSLSGELEHFVANGCQSESPVVPRFMSAALQRADFLERAEILLGKYPTIDEFDASW